MALKGYGKYTPEAAEREKEELDKVFGARVIKLKVGRNVVRVLPPKEGRDTPFEMIWTHFVDVQDRTEVFACPRRMSKKPCPVCAKAEEMRTSGDEALFEKAKSLFARRQWYANAIDRKNPDEGVQLLAAGKEIMDQINAIRRELAEDEVDFTDPYAGMDLVIERKGTTKEDTEYTVQTRGIKTTQLGEDDETMQGLIDKMIDLNAKAVPPTAEEIMARLRGTRTETSAKAAVADGGGDRRQASLPSRTAEDDAMEEPDAIDTTATERDSDDDIPW
jgi:hypothetical protein